MDVSSPLLRLLVGIAVLVYGSQRVVDGASTLARAAGVSVFFVGVTVVAVGSSLPEIATATSAALNGAGTIVVGHIVGSATSQITLGIGILALASPLVVAGLYWREEVGPAFGVGCLVLYLPSVLIG